MKSFVCSRIQSFRAAISGWGHVIRSQKNAWIHATVSVLVILVGLWLGISRIEWAIILLAIAIVWISEFLNTALEAVVDLASPQKHPLAKVGKDVGAAAVLLAAGSSVLVGLLILGPPLWEKIAGWLGK